MKKIEETVRKIAREEINNFKFNELISSLKDSELNEQYIQYNFIEKMYDVFGCEIIAIDDKEDVSDAEELTRDLMALLVSFSGKYYGRRSIENKRKNKQNKV